MRNFEIPGQHGLHLRLLFYELVKLDGVRLKIEGVLILCIVAVLPKSCFEKFAPEVRRLAHDLFLVLKRIVRPISQTIRRIEKSIFFLTDRLEVNLMYMYILRKSQF